MNCYRMVAALACCTLFLSLNPTVNAQQSPQSRRPDGILHQYPLAGSRDVTPRTDIGIRAIGAYDRKSLTSESIHVMGTISGKHEIIARLSSDNRTAIFHPLTRFALGEKVRVEFSAMLLGGMTVSDTFEFGTKIKDITGPGFNSELEAMSKHSARAQDAPVDRLPIFTITTDSGATPGSVYLTNFAFQPNPDSNYLLKLDEHGAVQKKQMLPGNHGFDFKIQPNGERTYFDWNAYKFYGLDTAWNLVDSFEVADGYSADAHELQVFPDGGYAIIGDETQPMNMRELLVRGDSEAVITANVIEIFDHDRNLVFNWRGFDHYNVMDAMHENLRAATIDFEHANSIDFDSSGNLILSNRHLCEITKIDGRTGDIIWRLGGAHSSFTLAGDSVWFSYQHAARLLPNGHLTLFDNSDFDTVIGYPDSSFQCSRALELELDTTTWTAKVIWQFHHNPETYGLAMGYVERLPNGNTFISWGDDTLTFTEVRPDNSTAFEMGMLLGNCTYRAIKYPSSTDTSTTELGVTGTPTILPSAEIIAAADGSASLRYSLPNEENVSISVYDLLGREIADAVSGNVESSGIHQVDLSLPTLCNGTYFCVLRSAEGIVTKPFEHMNR